MTAILHTHPDSTAKPLHRKSNKKYDGAKTCTAQLFLIFFASMWCQKPKQTHKLGSCDRENPDGSQEAVYEAQNEVVDQLADIYGSSLH